MPELRKDPITGDVSLIATDRAGRPHDFLQAELEVSSASDHLAFAKECPFCPGNECMTPNESESLLDADGDWSIRVVPNRYPAMTQATSTTMFGSPSVGRHEVVIEAPLHNVAFGSLPLEQIVRVVTVWRDRIRDAKASGEFITAMFFKNAGPLAGASLRHVHSQVVALPRIPTQLQRELLAARAYSEEFAEPGRCIFCDLLEDERKQGVRLVRDDGEFTIVTAYAPRYAFETWIFPNQHAEHFEEMEKDQIASFAQVLKEMTSTLEKLDVFRNYNVILHSAPFDIIATDRYHWHVEIVPRGTSIAGYEIGSGESIVAVDPESAAGILRKA